MCQTQEEFDVSKAGIGSGFLISGQDWSQISVADINFKGKNSSQAYLYEVVIEDLDFKVKYNRELKLVTSGSTFKIEDVLEMN